MSTVKISQLYEITQLNEAHRVSSIAWDKFYRNIKIELAKHPIERIDPKQMLKMSKEEFDKLIFSTDENLPADLKKYAPADKNAELQLTTKLFQDKMFSRIDLESLSPEILAKFRIRNKWRMCLQRAIQNISKDLLDADKDRTY